MSKRNSLLLVEDEINVASTLVEILSERGLAVSWATSVEEAELEIDQRPFDLAIVDVGLPDGDGFTVAQKLRSRSRSTAILFLTAHGEPEDRIKGLEIGAEDYVVKPFHLQELLLRVGNILKRVNRFSDLSQDWDEVRLGDARIFFSKFEIEKAGSRYSLTHKECELLKLLVERRGHVVSRDEILNRVWGENQFPSPRTIDNFIVRLRRMMGATSQVPLIKSIRGVGYQIT